MLRRVFPFLVLAFVAALVVTGLLVNPAQDHFQDAGQGIALGPARDHRPSPTDVFARLGTGAVGAAVGSSANPLTSPDPAEPTPQEQALLDLTNEARGAEGLPPVTFDPALLGVARTRAAAQLGSSPLSHYGALGELAFVGLLGEAGVDYTRAGENLARSQKNGPTVVSGLQQALMNSPTHRANILEPAFSSLAIGSAVGDSGQIAFAQIFRTAPGDAAAGGAARAN